MQPTKHEGMSFAISLALIESDDGCLLVACDFAGQMSVFEGPAGMDRDGKGETLPLFLAG
jgi:hypothetical protein